jgi:hypothetical protein
MAGHQFLGNLVRALYPRNARAGTFYQQHKTTALVWGVTFEDSDRDRILEFVERLGVSYPILGLGQDPLTGYGEVRVLPTTFLINPEGLFQHRFEGPISAQDIIEEIDRQR